MSTIAVLAGGRSSEHEVSLASGEGVRVGLAEAGHDVLDVRVERDGRWTHRGEELALRPGGGLLGAEVVFPVLHGPFGEDGTVQGLLECLGTAYVGAGVLASALCMDKVVMKEVMARRGIPQVAHLGVRAGEWAERRRDVVRRVARLGFPLWVKPARLGSSVGIVKVREGAALPAALDTAFRHDDLAVAEATAFGGDAMEVECSLLGDEQPEVSEPGEIVIAAEWYDYEAKYTPGGMRLQVPARISATARERLRAAAREAWDAVGCTGLARADFFVRGDEVLLNELNTMPGQTPTSVYGELWTRSGLSYPRMLDRLVELARARHARRAALVF